MGDRSEGKMRQCRVCRSGSAAPNSSRCYECMKLCSKCRVNRRAPGHHYCAQCKAEAQRVYRGVAVQSDEAKLWSKARSYVQVYLKRGRLQRGLCEACGDTEVVPMIANPNKPLEGLRWLCRRHAKEERRFGGS